MEIRESVKLHIHQWINLMHIAHKTGSFGTRGSRVGKQSWRVLLRRIADNELLLVPRTTDWQKRIDANGPIGTPPAPP